MVPGQRSIAPDPLPWAVVVIRMDVAVGRFPTEWSALIRAMRLNRLARDCVYTVDLAPREPVFRFTLLDGETIDGPGATVDVALMRMQRHPEEFRGVEQMPYPSDVAERVG